MCRHLMNWPDGIRPELSPYLCSFSAWWHSGLLRRSSPLSCSCESYFVISVSLHMYFVMRVCWFVCLSLMLRIFGMLSLQIGYRILNCIINFLVLHFWFLSFAWGLLKFFSKSFFVAVIVLSMHSYLEFVCVGWYFDRFFVCRNGITEFAKTGQVSDDTINLINY